MRRRSKSSIALLLTAVSILGACRPPGAPGEPLEPEPEVPARPWWEFGMADPVLDETVLYYLGGATFGATEPSEVLETASRVVADDPYSWPREWKKTAERLNAVAEGSDAAGHRITAGQAFYRSSTYLRAALHRHPDPYDPEVKALAELAVARFKKYLERIYKPEQVSVVEVPYEGTTLLGYYFHGASPGLPAPTLIVHSGRDAWAEDLVYTAQAAMARGYNALLIDGPGQGKVMRIQGLPFRPDWERFITPVIDYLLTQDLHRDEVDPEQIVLMGASMGGYLAPRAAVYEPRVRYLVANPGVVSWYQSIVSTLGSYVPDFEALLASDPAAFDQAIARLMAQSEFFRWGFVDMAWHHGVRTPSELMNALKPYTIEDKVGDIGAHTLVIDAEDEGPRGQSSQLFEQLRPDRRDLVTFTREEAAQFHVQPGATTVLTHKVFDWLDAKLRE